MAAKETSTESTRVDARYPFAGEFFDGPVDPADLMSDEIFWRDHQEWLEHRGYVLRPRYRPGWVASWKGTDKWSFRCEDGQIVIHTHIMDATRISDGEMVMLKHISKTIHPYEVQLGLHFTEEPLGSHHRNHCVPLYEVLDMPDEENGCMLVMPLLRDFSNPRIKSIGEAAEFFRQVFEGLQFMHQSHVAHRDCMNLNIMQDPRPTFPNMYHPSRIESGRDNLTRRAKYFTRTARPTKYYFIDFGISRKYRPEDGPPLEDPIRGGDRTVPEFRKSHDACNPFPTDIYYIGNMIREDFLQKTHGVEFMEPLVADMVQDDPSLRPTIDEVVERYDKMLRSLRWWKLRRRLVYDDEDSFDHFLRPLHHFFRTTAHVLLFRPAIPTPRV